MRQRQLVPPHELREVSKEIWIGLAREDEGSGRLPPSVYALSPSHMISYDAICAVGFLSGEGLGGRYHSWRMDALRKGRGLCGRYHSWPMDAHG